MKKRIFFITVLIFLMVSGCVSTPPVKHPQYTESNLPKVYKINAVPYIRQGHDQCFPACLLMIFKFYGKEIPLQDIDNWIRGARGTSTQAAEQYCNMRGFKTYVFYDWKGDKIKYFLSQGYPLIAYVQTGAFETGFHVIVLTGYDDEKQVFYINDPARKDKEISYKEFIKIRSTDPQAGQNKYYTLLIWPPTSGTKVLHMSTTEISTLTIPPQGVEIIPKPQWIKGNTWIRQTDKVKLICEIEKVDSSGIILRQGESRLYYDDNFALIKKTLKEKTVYEYNPPYKQALFFPLWVGKKWENNFEFKNFEKGTIYNFTESVEVKGWEDIQTAAGVLKTLKIELNLGHLDTGGRWTYTLWYSPQVKNYVKSSSEHLKELNWILADFIVK
ncbi:MAG: C39 family peptidase [Deltaproteobacteria bacterium]|nr:C39 family peptidase [Deltaproteobacteria bacterium]